MLFNALVALLLIGAVVASRTAPPPSRRTPVVLIAAVTGGLGGTALSVVLTYSGKGDAALWSSAIAVVVCSIASWLLRAPADDEEDGGSDRLSGGGPDHSAASPLPE